MNDAATPATSPPVLERGPFFRLLPPNWRDEPPIVRPLRRAVALSVVAWLPLLLLSWFSDRAIDGTHTRSLLGDAGAWFRYLVAIPAFVFAAPICGQRLSAIAWHFIDAGLVAPGERGRFEALLARARGACESRLALVGVIAVAYLASAALFTVVPRDALLPWQLASDGRHASPAGAWQWAVSGPLLTALTYVWIWRWLVWFWLLLRIARMPLRLTAPHPDRSAGLRFVGYSVQAFHPVAFAVGAIAAGRIGNEMIHHGRTIADIGPTLGITVAIVVAFVCLPTFAFSIRLLNEWRSGVFQYGRVAGEVERAVKAKWTPKGEGMGAEVLASPDFSAATDTNSYVAGAYDMRLSLLDLRSVAVVVVAMLLPMIPVVLATVPLDVLFEEAAKMLF